MRLLIIVGALVVTAALIWLIWFSSVLSVRSARVEGAPEGLTDQVLAAAQVPIGVPIARLDTAGISERVVAAFPWVASTEVRRGYPSEAVIVVIPRVAIARSADDKAVDATGVVYAPPAPLPSTLPRIKGTDPDALAAAIAVRASLPPEILDKLTSMSARSMDDIRFTLRSGAEVRWGSADQAGLKVRVLTALLARRARMYDVSAPELPTTFDENPRKTRPTPIASPSGTP